MKKVIVCISYILLTFFILIQVHASSKIDSLSLLIKLDKEDTDKINHLNELAFELRYSNPDTSIILSTQALGILNNSNNFPELWKQFAESRSLNMLAIFHYLKGNYSNALDSYLRALAILEKLENSGISKSISKIRILKSMIISNIGVLYDEQGEYQKALDYYNKALKMAEVLGNKKQIASKLGNIGVTYKNIALSLPNKYEYFAKRDSLFNEALNKYFNALKIDEELGNKNHISIWLGNIGEVYYDKHKFDKALEYYFKALKLVKELNDQSNMSTWLGNIGSVFIEQNKFQKSYNYLYNSLALAQNTGSLIDLKSQYEHLSSLYEKSNIPLPDSIGGRFLNMEQMRLRSLYYFKRSVEIRDTLFNQENKKQLVQKEMNYEFDKKEAATKAEHDKQIAIEEAENRKQKIIIVFVVFGLLIVIAFAIFITRVLHITRKQKQIIEEQKKIVDEANEELFQQNEEIAAQRDEIEAQRDTVTTQKIQIENIHSQLSKSVDYATRIQTSILPDLENLKTFLTDHFVLFRPKDKVSGDFYWYAVVENNLIISVADCTGHGVPGAFMSMLGISFLREIVVKENISNPANILGRLRMEIIQVLKQGSLQSKQKDGMDMSLIVINNDTLEMQYAGANNPLYIVKAKTENSEPELIELKPDNMPIAIYENMDSFTNHVHQLNKGDRLYLKTDGYEDQFGGEKYKKYTANRLKEILLTIHSKPMNEQHEILNRTISDWMNTQDQIDDITLMGIEI